MSWIHVSPDGNDDWPGTIERPFASLAAALERTRSRGPGIGDETVVSLHAGRHVLAEPLVLTVEDSGMVLQAYGGEPVILSGGRQIHGWQDHGGIWRAEVGDLDTRQLSVDGRRAERARLDGTIPGNVRRTATGYVTDAEIPLTWQGAEFVYTGVYPWTEARIGVASVTDGLEGAAITMEQPAFDWARRLYNFVTAWTGGGDIGTPSRVENSLAFLAEPGTFVLDRSTPGAHVLFYRPCEGEQPGSTVVIAPALEHLILANGVRGLSLRGLTFSDTTWLRPSRPEGFLHYHGCAYYDGGDIQTIEFADGSGTITVPDGGTLMVESSVVFQNCDQIEVSGSTFTRLGSNALEFLGCRDILVERNTIGDISGAAILVGSGTKDTRIENNLIRGIGLEYQGVPAIHLAEPSDISVSRNEIREVPHAGIVIYGGRTTSGVRIEYNLIRHSMMVLADGGGIYLAKPQGSSFSTGTLVRGNVVLDTMTAYNFALYADYGATWTTFQGNLVGRADKPTVLDVSPALDNVVFLGNIWDAPPDRSDSPPAGVTLLDNRIVAASAFQTDPVAADIIAAAGIQPTHTPNRHSSQ